VNSTMGLYGRLHESQNTLFELVVLAARAGNPDAVITSRLEQGYLRVSRPLPGGGSGHYPVGVTELPKPDAVDAFTTGVHAFMAADQQVPSEGPPR
jgi:hypothetical protein